MVGAVDNFNRILALRGKHYYKEKSTSILSKILGIDYTPCIPNSDGPTLHCYYVMRNGLKTRKVMRAEIH